MQICLASIHPRALSGQIVTLVGLAKALEQRGHHVTAVSAIGDTGAFAYTATTPEEHSPLREKVERISGILSRLVSQSREADLVHVNLPTPAFSILGDFVQRLAPVPVIVGFEAHLAEVPRLMRSRDIIRAPRFYVPRALVNNGLIARCTWHGAARYVVSSERQAQELRRLGFPKARIRVLANVIDSERVERLEKPAARRILGLPEGPLLAYAGHYHHVKGADSLVQAFRHLAAHDDRLRLVLAWSGIGDPGLVEDHLRGAGLEDRIIRLGQVPMGALLSAVDVFALPYRYTMGQNAFPALVLEAMAVGVPLVTSDLALLREVAHDDETAILAQPGDVPGLAQGIVRLLYDQPLRERMVAAQRRLMANGLDPAGLAAQYEHLYESVLARKAGVLCPKGHH
jgi:glycosyltransferase involved in cell wall biosynthesis